MKRKDCDRSNRSGRAKGGRAGLRSVMTAAIVIGVTGAEAVAGSVRVWPTGVVTADQVRLRDVATLRGFETAVEQRLGDTRVAPSPPRGESSLVDVKRIRTALSAAGANMARVTFSGAFRCTVSRAGGPVAADDHRTTDPQHRRSKSAALPDAPRSAAHASAPTLQGEVIRYFNREAARYSGEADVVFDRSAASMLDLTGPKYMFKVRRRSASPFGLVQLEVVVLADGATVQTVPLVVRVGLVRNVVVARRPINQGATIRASDVHTIPTSFTRTDRLGVIEPSQVIGQRARRFIPSGELLEPDQFEPVPLVTRGQIVQLRAEAGSVRVVTTAKAMGSGRYGDAITVRSMDRKRVEFDGVIVGPGIVRAGSAATDQARLFAGGENPS